jgi:hypothetical protein
MKPWIGEYPATFMEVLSHSEIKFLVHLGFDITIRTAITFDVPDLESSKKVFLKRKLEHMLTNAQHILLRFFWDATDDCKPIVDIEVDHEDLIEKLEAMGYLE